MTILIAVLSMLCFALALAMALLGVLRDLLGDSTQHAPKFQDPAPAFQSFESRSQFAWQSRSHFREPD
jgi:hypothetical protein